MKNIKNKTIAIIGGGPGGLTLARLLQTKGADVTVYERDAHKHARPKGARLDIHEKHMLTRASKTADITLDSTEALHSANATSWIVQVIS